MRQHAAFLRDHASRLRGVSRPETPRIDELADNLERRAAELEKQAERESA